MKQLEARIERLEAAVRARQEGQLPPADVASFVAGVEEWLAGGWLTETPDGRFGVGPQCPKEDFERVRSLAALLSLAPWVTGAAEGRRATP